MNALATRLILAAGLTLAPWCASPAKADPLPERLIIATWNVEWLFDDYPGDNFGELPRKQSAPTQADWEWKLAGVAEAIAEMKPTILALQEVENRRVLYLLTRTLKNDYGLEYQVAFIEGEDYGTEQDVAVLARSGLVGMAFKRQSQEMFASKRYYDINKHLFCLLEWGTGDDKLELLLLNVHLRAQPEAAEIRKRQALLARHWIGDTINAGRHVVVLGDLNTEEMFETASAESELGILRGQTTEAVEDDLVDLFAKVEGKLEETHLVHKQFDHILATPSMMQAPPDGPGLTFREVAIRKDLVVRGAGQDKEHLDAYWKIPAAERDLSDHYPVVAEFEVHK